MSGFPTIKYFPSGDGEPETYTGSRDIGGFVDFLNSKVMRRAFELHYIFVSQVWWSGLLGLGASTDGNATAAVRSAQLRAYDIIRVHVFGHEYAQTPNGVSALLNTCSCKTGYSMCRVGNAQWKTVCRRR